MMKYGESTMERVERLTKEYEEEVNKKIEESPATILQSAIDRVNAFCDSFDFS